MRHTILTYPTPDLESIKKKRGSLIFQSYKKNSLTPNDDPKLQQLKSEQQAMKLKSMVNGSSNITSFKISNALQKMKLQLKNLPNDEVEIKLLNTFIHQYNQMLSLDGGVKKKGKMSISIDSADYNRAKQVVQRNGNSLNSFYKDIKYKAHLRYKGSTAQQHQQYHSTDKIYRIRHSSYIPSIPNKAYPEVSEFKTPIKQKMDNYIIELSNNCSRILQKNKKLRAATDSAGQKIRNSLSMCQETLTKLEKENKRSGIYLRLNKKVRFLK